MNIEDVIIDEEFEDFLPALQPEERNALKNEIEKDGFTDAIIVWMNHGELVDGYNRYRIWLELGANSDNAPEIIERKFSDRAAVMEWMFHHQFARRNATAAQRAATALKMKPALAARAKVNEKSGGGDKKSGKQAGKSGSMNSSNPIRPVDTRKEIAAIAGVSEDTVRKTEIVLEQGKASTTRKMLAGEISANEAFRETKQTQKSIPDDRQAASLLAKVTADIARVSENMAHLVRAWDAMKASDPSFQKKHQELLGHHSRLFQVCEDGKRIVKKLNEVWSK